MRGRQLNFGWVVRMAWRDSRSSRGRLILFTSSIIIGIGALVAIASLGRNLDLAIEQQARTLLGADLSISSNQPFGEEANALFETIGGEISPQVSFSSMAFFPKEENLRLCQVRALEGEFPYYGRLETDPATAAAEFQEGPYALVDDVLMKQYHLEVGDSVRLGEFSFRILGRLLSIPGESMVFSLAAPRIFIPLRYLEETRLIQPGSRVGYRVFFKLPETVDPDALVEELEPRLEELKLGSTTVQERKRRLGRSLDNLYRFLNLVGFIALILGSIGVASAIHLYIKQKLATVAVLRCLGCSSRQTVAIYLTQAAALGLVGALAGSLLGISIQFLLPKVLSGLIPVQVPFSISMAAVLTASAVGLGIALLFALLPLLPVRHVSPLLALRAAYESPELMKDPARWAVYGLISGAVLVFAVVNSAHWYYGVFFFLGLVVAFALLAGVARLIVGLVRRFFPQRWSYVWRQGLANLYRPQNQTVVLMLSVGLGTFLIVTLHLVEGTLLSQAAFAGAGDRPNLVLFDIQSDQKEGVAELVRDAGAPILQDVPIVTMRLAAVKGRSVEEIREDPNRVESGWALRREYRSTYRSELSETETVVAGKWVGKYSGEEERVPISLEEEIASDLNLSVGDELVFDVQGVPVPARVGSIRGVEWERVQPNFFAVFPIGVLESAPQFHVLVTRTDSTEQSARIQRDVVARYPNVSAIDLALILSTVDNILDRISFVIRFMALFSIFTGLIVLAGAVVSGRYQRITETVLLRTLGASRQQILKILSIEYLFLGSFAALTGLVLSVVASWLLAFFLFDDVLAISFQPVVLAFLAVTGLTMAIGLANSWTVLDRPPLEVLRQEV